jgi:hypothetical protein
MDGRRRVFDNIFVERLWRSVKYEDIYIGVQEGAGVGSGTGPLLLQPRGAPSGFGVQDAGPGVPGRVGSMAMPGGR